jgi:hypothetical protein
MTLKEEYFDAAFAALGNGMDDGEEFMLTGDMGISSDGPIVRVECGFGECNWGYAVGMIPVWEVVVDCRQHWEEKHAAQS